MDKKLLALLILASLSPAEAALTKIPAGFEVIAQGQQEYIEVYFSGKNLGKYYAMVNLDTVTFLIQQVYITSWNWMSTIRKSRI